MISILGLLIEVVADNKASNTNDPKPEGDAASNELSQDSLLFRELPCPKYALEVAVFLKGSRRSPRSESLDPKPVQ